MLTLVGECCLKKPSQLSFMLERTCNTSTLTHLRKDLQFYVFFEVFFSCVGNKDACYNVINPKSDVGYLKSNGMMSHFYL